MGYEVVDMHVSLYFRTGCLRALLGPLAPFTELRNLSSVNCVVFSVQRFAVSELCFPGLLSGFCVAPGYSGFGDL